MAKRLNYTIGFTGDTSQLKAAINDAVGSLQKLSTSSVGQLTPQLQQASNAAMQLSMHMTAAMNPTTKKFDLSLFNESLRKSKTSLSEYATQLKALGPEGEKAFLKTANAIMQAEIPAKRLKGLMGELWNTMKNTMRWQLTSSMLHGFMGAVQTAYGYVQDLDESLNNIRIVSGKSSNEMARFAVEANKAARALNTTTNEYAKASLIYYQQGLAEDEIKERTDATVQMANVTGQSAEIVSEQMTAIWNNFDDGSKSLEYYADVITALGAATASSTDEISQGLEKFAGVAGQIGLSYEYATSALATVTATTRESATTVGTAFKTLFSRIQGLQLGETLEDGTTLNKYSEALAIAGVSISNQNGALRDMDEILVDLGDKWTTLTRDQQMALAQTVAGVRQYTQFITLMDNWGTFEENLGIAKGSEGELKKQADIFAESWEAARNRVRASAEDIYDSLINSQDFIDLNNSLADTLDRIGDMVDALGGLKGVFVLLGSIATSVFQKQMASGLRSVVAGAKDLLGISQKQAQELKKNSAGLSKEMVSSSSNSAMKIEAESYQKMAKIQATIYKNQDLYNQSQQDTIKAGQQIVESLREQAVESEKVAIAARRSAGESESWFLSGARENLDTSSFMTSEEVDADIALSNELTERLSVFNQQGLIQFQEGDSSQLLDYSASLEKVTERTKTVIQESTKINSIRQRWAGLESDQKKNVEIIQAYQQEIKELGIAGVNIDDIEQGIIDLGKHSNDSAKELRELVAIMRQLSSDPADVDDFINSLQRMYEAGQLSEEQLKALLAVMDRVEQEANNPIPNPYDWADGLVAVGNSLMNVSMAIQAVQNLGSIWSDENLSDTEKMSQALMSLVMIAPMFGSTVKGIKNVTASVQAANAATTSTAAAAELAAGAQQSGGIAGLFLSGASKQVASSGMSAAKALGVVALKAAILVAIVGLVVWGISELIKEYNKEAIALENTKQSLDSATQAYEHAKTAKEEFLNVKTNYEDEAASLDELTKGTEEYAEALKSANEKAIELIKTYDLYDQFSYDSNGLIVFEEGILENAENKIENRITKAKRYQTSVEIDYQRAILENEKAKARKELPAYIKWETTEKYRENAGNVFFIDGKLSELKKEEIVDEIIKSEKDISAMSDNEFYDFLKELDSLKSSSKDLAGVTDESLNTIVSQKEAFENLIKTVNSTASAMNFLTKQLEKDYVSNEYGEAISSIFSDPGTADLVTSVIAEQVKTKEEYIESGKRWEAPEEFDTGQELRFMGFLEDDDPYSPGQIYEKITSDEDLMKHWMVYTGKAEWEDYDSMVYEGGSGKGTITFEEQTYKANDEQMRKELAEIWYEKYYANKFEAIEKGSEEEQVQNIIDTSEELQKSDIGMSILSASAAGQTFWDSELDLSNVKDFSKMQDLYFTKNNESGNEKLLESLGLNEETLKTMGYESGEAFISSFKKGVERQQIDNLTDKLFKGEGEISKKLGDKFKGNQKEAKKAAEEMIRYANAMKIAKENLSDWKKAAEDHSGTLDEQTQEFKDARSAIAGFLNVSEEDIKFDIDTTALDNFEKAIQGDEVAFNDLQQKMLEGLGIKMNTSIKDESGDEISIGNMFNNIMAEYWNLQSQLEANPLNPQLDLTSFSQKLTQFVNATGMSIDTANAWIGSLKGVDATVVEASDEQTTTQTYVKDFKVEDHYAVGPDGFNHYMGSSSSYTTDTIELPSKTMGAGLEVKVDGMDPSGGDIDFRQILRDSSTPGSKPSGTVTGNGGGGGSSSKAKEPKKESKKLYEDDYKIELPEEFIPQNTVDVFEDINNSLEKIADTLDTVGELADRAWGTEKIVKYGEQLNSLRVEEEALLSGIDQAEAERETAFSELDALISVGISRDEQGNITNFAQIRKEIDDEVNAANRMAANNKIAKTEFRTRLYALPEAETTTTTAEDGTETVTFDNKEAFLQFARDNYIKNDYYSMPIDFETPEDFENFVEQMEAVYDVEIEKNERLAENLDRTQNDALDRVIDAQDQVKDLNDSLRENWQTQADVHFDRLIYSYQRIYDFKDLEDSARDFYKSIEEMGGNALKNITESFDYDMESAISRMDEFNKLTEEYYALTARIGENYEWDSEADYRDRQQEILEQLMSNGEDMLGFLDTYSNMLIDAISVVREEMDKFTAGLEHNISVLENYKEIYSLTASLSGKSKFDAAGDAIDVMNAQIKAQHARTMSLKTEHDIYLNQMQQAQEQMDKYSYDPEGILYKTWKASYEAAKEAAHETEEEMLASAAESLQTAQDIMLAQIDRYLAQLEEKMTQGMGFDYLQSQYDRMITEEERYLDAVNESYELTKLNNEVQRSIDDANSLSAANTLKQLKQEIALRKESGKLTQYDVDILNAKYQLTKAQIALEEAQNNKSSMRLARNAQGNWDYVFTANQDEIDKAQANYDKAVNDYYNLAKEQAAQSSADRLAAEQQFWSDLNEIWTDSTLSEEQKLARSTELWQNFEEDVSYFNDQIAIATQDMSEASELSVGYFENRLGEMVEYTSVDMDELEGHYNEALAGMQEANTDYENNVNTITDEAGLDYDSLDQKVSETESSTRDLQKASNDAAWELNKNLKAVNDSAVAYGSLALKIWEAVDAYKEFTQQGVHSYGADQSLQSGLGKSKLYDEATDYSALITEMVLKDGLSLDSEEVQKLFTQRGYKIEDLDLGDAVISNENLKLQLQDVLGSDILGTKVPTTTYTEDGLPSTVFKEITPESALEDVLDIFVAKFGLNKKDASMDMLTEEEWGSIARGLAAGSSFESSIAMSGMFDSWEEFLERVTGKDITQSQIQESVQNTYHINLDNINVQDGTELVDTVLYGLPMRAQQESSTNKW